MFDKVSEVSKKIFKRLNDFLHFMQIFLIFLSFGIILYWLLDVAQVPAIQHVAPFFESIKEVTHVFYKRTVTVDDITMDFSFLVATLVILLIVMSIRFFIEELEYLEKKCDNYFYKERKKEEALFNIQLAKENLMEEYKNNSFICLINFSASHLSGSFSVENSVEARGKKRKEILKEFSKDFKDFYKNKYSKHFIDEGAIFGFTGFDNVEDVVAYLGNYLKDLKSRYHQNSWCINYIVSFDVFADKKEVSEKINDLIVLNQVNLEDEFLCTAGFRYRYSLNKRPKYIIEEKGLYTINSEAREIFVLKS